MWNTTRFRTRVLGLLCLLAIITYLDRVCISVAGPRIQEALRISPLRWGWVAGVFTIAYAIFEIPSGAMGDRIGPRRVLTRIVLWWSAFTALTGAASNYYLLLLTRFCFGMGGAISPLLVVPIQSRYGWRAPFYVFGVLGVVWGMAWYALFRDSPAEMSG